MKYPARLIALHWLMAGLILAMLGSGLAFSFELAGRNAIIFHQWAGQALLALLVVRIAVRLTSRIGENPQSHATWETWLAGLVHLLLYALMIAFVVTGYVSASGLRDPALLAPISQAFARSDMGEMFLDAHYALKWALLAVLGLHIAGALKHALIDRDGTIRNMWFPQKG